jgi:hypothetical protein
VGSSQDRELTTALAGSLPVRSILTRRVSEDCHKPLWQRGQTLADALGWYPRLASEALSHCQPPIGNFGTIPERSSLNPHLFSERSHR